MVIRAMTEVSPFALEITTCPDCGHLLSRYEFGFDWLGRTMSLCPKCGPRLLTVRHGAPVAKHTSIFKTQVIGKCADCPKKLTWRGTGTHPMRCPPCRKKHERVQDLASYHRRSA